MSGVEFVFDANQQLIFCAMNVKGIFEFGVLLFFCKLKNVCEVSPQDFAGPNSKNFVGGSVYENTSLITIRN